MIDHEKLKIACDLILKVDEKYSLSLHVSCNFDPYFRLSAHNTDWFQDYDGVEEVIERLQGLVKPQSKYKKGDIVWMLDCENEPCELEIKDIDIGAVEKYLIRNEWRMEHALYPTKALLIEAQIQYWTCLKNEELSTHNPDMSMPPPFEGEIKGFNAHYALSEEGQAKIRQGLSELAAEHCQISGAKLDKCDHTFVLITDDPECIKCGKLYVEVECQHEPEW